MSSDHDLSLDFNLPDHEIRRRLTQEFKFDCGPITATTRPVLLKKLTRLENERNSSKLDLTNGHIHEEEDGENSIADTSVSHVDESLIINGKPDSSNDHQLHRDISFTPSPYQTETSNLSISNQSVNGSTEHEDAIFKQNSIDSIIDEAKQVFYEINKQQVTDRNRVSKKKQHLSAIFLDDSLEEVNAKVSGRSFESEKGPKLGHDNQSFSAHSFVPNSRTLAHGEIFKRPLCRPPIRRSNKIGDESSDQLSNMFLANRSGRVTASSSLWVKLASFFRNSNKESNFTLLVILMIVLFVVLFVTLSFYY